MSRLATKFSALKSTNSKALATFITAGDPDLHSTEEVIYVLEKAGADIIELGVPFSDPMADGPTIQLSSERALKAGTNLPAILQLISKVRNKSEIPIILMGYLNPIHAYGYESFFRDAAKAGVDGILIVDMPPEESGELSIHAKRYEIDIIFLLTPTSDASRIATVEKLGSGFVYYVTVTGVTGARSTVSASLAMELNNVKQVISLPIMAGFGISTPKQATDIADMADGVVVGSSIVRLFENYTGEELKQRLHEFVSKLKQAI